MLTAIFTTRPMGFSESSNDNEDRPSSATPRALARSDDIVGILASITPNLPKILVEPDRVLTAANTISTSLIGPTLKSKNFPDQRVAWCYSISYLGCQIHKSPGRGI